MAGEATPDGCRVGVVGPGTPAEQAGLRVGDVITAIDAAATADSFAVHDVLKSTRPGTQVTLDVIRDGSPLALTATLGRRPLEVVRPEFRGEPVADVDGEIHDPLSFVLSFETRDGRRRKEPLAEMAGQELADVDWEAEPTADGAGVRFTRQLAGGLRVAKEYRLSPES